MVGDFRFDRRRLCGNHQLMNGLSFQRKTARTRTGFALFAFAGKMLAVSCPLSYSVQRRIMSEALMPPKPKEFDRAMSKLWAMALLGT
jgi:hypothetical protein